MDLESLLNKKRSQLKSCQTIVTDTSGRKFCYENGEKRELEKGLSFIVDTKPDLEIVEIISGLYLSSQDPVMSEELLLKYSIKNILSIGIQVPVKFNSIRYYFIEILDLPEFDIFQCLKQCLEIIDNCCCHGDENILVHCNAGISRSPTIVIAYLMAREKLTFHDAFQRVKLQRERIKPNEGFIRQLTMNSQDIQGFFEYNFE
ncbi:probable dual specificity protein phosphatase DDB_G0283417 [Leptopilina heterotoma]|uniref:probable dual specificity protein phosphatase DDB_G0283417 n=1 Tax=Leptopilina heterotoma TaxID=63436 RepID=UPI001CA9643F|nr:probable dual specificity protein phosphatase DDB_G0283417 [Leptopilina heterotoma]